MKVYKKEYKTPFFLLLSLKEEDILTASLGEDEGTQTPMVDEGGDWRRG